MLMCFLIQLIPAEMMIFGKYTNTDFWNLYVNMLLRKDVNTNLYTGL